MLTIRITYPGGETKTIEDPRYDGEVDIEIKMCPWDDKLHTRGGRFCSDKCRWTMANKTRE